eukprot:CAMPEP_0116006258 /NCGR_PEP_ID=MMETSP0321-20121206/1625_1 /TAXON_ID=163516 /ORGANISM="Leptocylindrus danicus var. danicus, Strain B650" /LENGTH=1118 /DNA_ID=CAMNT_0003474785 /DNA_START=236 /DNA_END=3592 /DNA_ORIENTATION=+
MSGNHLSKEFFELIKNIGESKSKQEEDRIMRQEVQTLKGKLDSARTGGKPQTTSKKKQKEFLVRLLYVEMLGHNGSFGYIKAVELAASSSISHKKLGYLVCSACLSPENEFRFMLINQLQRDLSSSHVLETACSLIALCNLATLDMIPAVSNAVIQALDHGSDMIRKKAIHALYKCYQMDPSIVSKDDLIAKLRKILCDRDPGVMGASLGIMEALAKVNPTPFKDLVPSLVSILKQIIEHRLPREYDYHRMPAPWMQMSILRILRVIGKGDMQASQGMYEMLGDCMKRADIGINVGYAVVYECIRTVTTIYPNVVLLDAAADAISRFISSRNHNLKYLGVTGLAAIVESHPKYATAHQLAVMDCLESPDITLAHRTLELLYRMTNPHNVEFIIEKLLDFLRGGKQFHSDDHLQRTLTFKIANLAERFAPSNEWYVETITQLLEISGNVPLCKKGLNKVGNQLMQLIAEGEGGGEEDDDVIDDTANISLRRSTVNTYINILLSPANKSKSILQYPDVFIQIMSWILGEYGYLADQMSVEGILERICQLISKKHSSAIGGQVDLSQSSKITTRYLFNAIFKLVAQAGTCPPAAAQLIAEYTASHDVELQQRCNEFHAIITGGNAQILGEVLPIDASCEDLMEEDGGELSFLDGFVQEKLNTGYVAYSPPENYDEDDDYDTPASSSRGTAFNMTPYAKPPTQGQAGAAASRVYNPNSGSVSSSTAAPSSGMYPSSNNSGGATQLDANGQPVLNLRNAANVWGKQAQAQTQAPSSSANNASNNSIGGVGSSVPTNPYAPSSSHNPYGQPQPPPTAGVGIPISEPSASRELSEREKMASALFGGVGGVAPSTSAAASRRARRTNEAATVASASSNVNPVAQISPTASPAIAPVPAPAAVAEEPMVDLLDMGAFGDALPPSNDAPPVASVVNDDSLDVLTSMPIPAAPVPVTAPAPVAVEESSSSIPEPAAPAPVLDPFADMAGVEDKPLPAFGAPSLATQSAGFQHNGEAMKPLTMTTPEFGGTWGGCPFTNTASVASCKASNLTQFMKLASDAGLHPVEAIGATNEGICAGKVGSITLLVHGKLTPSTAGAMMNSKVDLTIKATNIDIGSAFGVFLSNFLAS